MIEINKIYNLDCVEGLNQLQDSSVDLVVVDPPYYKVMTTDHKGNSYEWDKQWKNMNEYIKWCKSWFLELKRILKPNGSLYIFADDKNVAYIQVVLDEHFYLENHITWVKPNNMTIKGWNNFRCYSPITERILFYSKESRNTNLENESYSENIKVIAPIIEYMIKQKKKIKEYFNFKTDKEFNDYINKLTDTKSVVSRHYFTYSQWVFPSEEIYNKLQTINKDIFSKDFYVFKKEFVELREEYKSRRRYFNPKKNFTDVWTFNITSSKEKCSHPTQKPISLIRRIIETSSKEGDLIVDCFMGSGTTALACKQLNRNFIGFELNKEYIYIAEQRLKQKVLHEQDYWSSLK